MPMSLVGAFMLVLLCVVCSFWSSTNAGEKKGEKEEENEVQVQRKNSWETMAYRDL